MQVSRCHNEVSSNDTLPGMPTMCTDPPGATTCRACWMLSLLPLPAPQGALRLHACETRLAMQPALARFGYHVIEVIDV